MPDLKYSEALSGKFHAYHKLCGHFIHAIAKQTQKCRNMSSEFALLQTIDEAMRTKSWTGKGKGYIHMRSGCVQ